jgi:hypothetical protein
VSSAAPMIRINFNEFLPTGGCASRTLRTDQGALAV